MSEHVRQVLIEGIARGPAGQGPNIVQGLRPVKDDALGTIAQRIEHSKTAEERVRHATVALHLGDLAPASRLLALGKDPSNRTAFIHNYAKWPGELAELVTVLRENKAQPKQADLRSGLCAALGYVALETLAEPQQQALIAALTELYQQAPDGGTHSAAAYTLTKWGHAPKTPPASDQPSANRDWFVNQLGMTMIKIPAGTFRMGDETGADDEKPPHPVALTQPCFVCDREVTLELFQKFIDDKDYPDDQKPADWKRDFVDVSPTPDCPVAEVSWEDAVLFCNWLSHKTGLQPGCYTKNPGGDGKEDTWSCDFQKPGYRLPTEAEWEYACRAQAETAYSFGEHGEICSGSTLGSLAMPKVGPSRRARSCQTAGDCSTCTATSGNGAGIGMATTIINS